MTNSILATANVSTGDLGIVRCRYGFGSDPNNDRDVSKERGIQVDQVNALKMDMWMKDHLHHCD